MKKIAKLVDAGNIKFRSAFRDTMYGVLKKKDESGVLKNLGDIFYACFAIGYHFDCKKRKEYLVPSRIGR